VRIDNLNDDMAQALGVPSGGKGALVTEVLEDTPAQKAGIRAGDVIVKVQGESVDDPDDLTRALRNHDGKVSLELLRKGARRTIDVDIPSRESTSRSWSRIPEPGMGSWGFSKTRDDDSAALRQEIEDLKKELQELREQIKAKK
jgi:serine protease Do